MIPVSILDTYNAVLGAAIDHPSEFSLRRVAAALAAKNAARAEQGQMKPLTAVAVPLGEMWPQGKAFLAAFRAAVDAFPAGTRIVWEARRSNRWNPAPKGARVWANTDVFERSGYNNWMRQNVYMVPAMAILRLGPGNFGAFAASFAECVAAGKNMAFWGVRLDPEEPKAVALREVYTAAVAAGVVLPELRFIDRDERPFAALKPSDKPKVA